MDLVGFRNRIRWEEGQHTDFREADPLAGAEELIRRARRLADSGLIEFGFEPAPVTSRTVVVALEHLEPTGPDIYLAAHFGLAALARREADRPEEILAQVEASFEKPGQSWELKSVRMAPLVAIGLIHCPKLAEWFSRIRVASGEILVAVGESLLACGADEALEILTRQIVESGNPDRLAKWAGLLVRSEHLEGVLPCFEALPEGEERDRLIAEATRYRVARRQPDEFLKLEGLVRGEKHRQAVSYTVAESWVEAGRLDEAASLIEKLAPERGTSSAASALGREWMNRGDFERGIAWVRRYGLGYWRQPGEIEKWLAALVERDGPESLEANDREWPDDEKFYRPFQLAEVFARCGDVARAEAVAERESDPQEKYRVFEALLKVAAESGAEFLEAQRSGWLAALTELAGRIPERDHGYESVITDQERAERDFAEHAWRAGDQGPMERHAARIEDRIRGSDDGEDLRLMRAHLAESWTRLGETDRLLELLPYLDAKENAYDLYSALFDPDDGGRRARALIPRLDDPDAYLQERLLELIAHGALDRLDDPDLALSAIRQCETISDSKDAWKVIANWHRKHGRFEEARKAGGAESYRFADSFDKSQVRRLFREGKREEALAAVRCVRNWERKPEMLIQYAAIGEVRVAVENLIRLLVSDREETGGESASEWRQLCREILDGEKQSFRDRVEMEFLYLGISFLSWLVGLVTGRHRLGMSDEELIEAWSRAPKPYHSGCNLDPVEDEEIERRRKEWNRLRGEFGTEERSNAGRGLVCALVSRDLDDEVGKVIGEVGTTGELWSNLSSLWAQWLAERHRPAQAWRVAESLRKAGVPDERLLLEIAKSFFDVEAEERAIEVLETYRFLVEAREPMQRKSYQITQAACLLVGLGKVNWVETFVELIPDPGSRAAAWCQVATWRRTIPEFAAECLERAEREAGNDEGLVGNRNVADTAMKLGRPELAQAAFEANVRRAERTEDRYQRCRDLAAVSRLAKDHPALDARPMVAALERTVGTIREAGKRGIENLSRVGFEWTEIAEAFLSAGESAVAAEVLSEARRIDSRDSRTRGLAEIVIRETKKDRWTPAARLCATDPFLAVRMAARLSDLFPKFRNRIRRKIREIADPP